MENLPSTEKQNNLLPFLPEVLEAKKCNTALAAYQSGSPSIAKIKKDFNVFKLELGITFILDQLFTLRFSKVKSSTILVEYFTSWLLAEYYYMNLQEIELALIGSRIETYQVIDLEILKVMIEDYQAKRIEAVQYVKQNPAKVLELESGLNSENKESNPVPMPEETKELINKLLVKDKLKPKRERVRYGNLEECLIGQGFKEPHNTAIKMREEWRKEHTTIHATAIENELTEYVEPLALFMKKKESYFISKFQTNQQNK